MKKISSPHKNSFVDNTVPTFSSITMEDIREVIDQLTEANIKMGYHIEVTEYDELHYRLSGSAYGIVRKDKWNDAMLKAGGHK